ncbi:MAG: hypothetical protein K8S16_07295 [Bacteroidales bacterium]|nr:hypothetical protein [Bacteroidales bacterium]
MSDQLKYKQVNWIDGMKVNKDHFIALENYFTAQINDQSNHYLNSHNYGLLPHKGDIQQFLSINTIIDNQNYLRVKIDSCHAITPGGYKIEISKENPDQGDFTLQNVETEYNLASAKDDDLFLIISIDPFSRIPDGKAEPTEYPLRMPFVNPEYKLDLIPTEQVIGQKLGPNMLIIGKIVIKNNKPEIIEEYIPPCTSIDSHRKLIEFYDYIDMNISSLEKNAVKIIYDVNEKQASNILTEIVTYVAENLLQFLSNNITGYKWFINSKPPIYIFEFIVSLARVLKNAFDIRTAEEKEVMLNYFSKHFDIVPSRFKQLLDNTIGLTYDHTEIYHSIEKSEDFMNVISLLFSELSKMELIAGKEKKAEPKKIDIILR